MNQRGSAHTTHAAHVEHGFIRTYIFSTDHKMIGRQYLFYGLFMMILGGLLALLVRWQLAWPEQPVLGFGWSSFVKPRASSRQIPTTCCSPCMPRSWCSS